MQVDEILNERHSQYGTFSDVARVAINLRNTIHYELKRQGKVLPPDQSEALFMICSKVARLVIGNSDHVDSWRDVAGYAQLVVDRLEGKSR
jgi:hypothetical protein